MPLHARLADPACSSVLEWLYLCDIQMSGQPRNLCWGGIVGHNKFSVFSASRLGYITNLTPFPRLMGHDGTVLV